MAIKAKLNRYNEVAELMATDYTDELMEEMGQLQEELDAADAWDIDSQLEQAMDALRCPPPDEPVTHLSGGERRRVALCKLLLSKPDLLLLDEPTNHLDAESVLWLEQHLAEYKGAILAVTHDRYFLDNVAEWILELDRGRAYPYEGNYSTYLEKKAERVAVQGRKDAKLQKRLQDELAWVRSGAKARQAKSKARLRPLRGDGRRGGEDPQARLRGDPDPDRPAAGQRRGRGRAPRQGLRRPAADQGSVVHAAAQRHRRRHRPQRCRQDHAVQDHRRPRAARQRHRQGRRDGQAELRRPEPRAASTRRRTVWEVVSDGLDYIEVGQTEIPSRAYVSAFGFKGPDQQKPAGVLSGGERNRLNLALTLKEGGNLILLDEPTNDLDVETLGSLENALEKFPGCAVVISHDRWFLDRTCTHILAWEGDDDNEAKWFWFEGNFGGLRREQSGTTWYRCGPSAQGDPPPAHTRLMSPRACQRRCAAVSQERVA